MARYSLVVDTGGDDETRIGPKFSDDPACLHEKAGGRRYQNHRVKVEDLELGDKICLGPLINPTNPCDGRARVLKEKQFLADS